MKTILVSNTAWKGLHKLKHQLDLRNTNQVVEMLIVSYRDEELNKSINDLFGV